ncbi:unnamed protein product [Staurois parvus]|uniref:C5orf34-like C-terminal domain-containing protein n=1 Tax=Staurois parvus TaxID=386267 RepID=A0ABN9CJD0_9NEOB|nr:unnamed protein product [Staurois parvus]
MPILLEQCFMPDKGKFSVYSDNLIIGNFLDGVILFMIWDFLLILLKRKSCKTA